jgi:hypothetical protein
VSPSMMFNDVILRVAFEHRACASSTCG